MTIAVLFILLFACLAMGVPVGFALGVASITTILLLGDDSLASLVLQLFETMQDHYVLLAIPFFILSSRFLTTGGVAERVIAFALACVGHLRGGLAMASVLACMLFAAVSGSSPATVVAIGSIVIAAMVSAGYEKPFAAGVVASAGTLGILIPPSIVMVVYAAATQVSVGRMFMAGVVPGLLAGTILMLAIYFRTGGDNFERRPRASLGELLKTGREAIWGLMLVVIVLGGIYGGVFTPTEAAAVAAVYAFLIATFVYKDMPLRETPAVLVDAGRLTIFLMFIIANAMLFSHVLTTERIPQIIAEAIMGAGLPPWAFLLVVNILLLIAGNFMEPSAILLIMAPILFPIAIALGIDPIHLGIIMVVNMEIGMITPPVGLNLFVTAGIAEMTLGEVVRAALPWLLLLLGFLALITYVPAVSLTLPNAMFGPQTL